MDKELPVSLNRKQIGTIVIFMEASLRNREVVKAIAKRDSIKHLDNLDDELKLMISLTKLLGQ
ncbi:hypothetical protein [Microcystis phage MaeS]|nr:hypothetical protein [Microcystis phage MaeS]